MGEEDEYRCPFEQAEDAAISASVATAAIFGQETYNECYVVNDDEFCEAMDEWSGWTGSGWADVE